MFRTPKKLTMFPILGTDIQIIIDDKHCDKENALGLYTDNRIILRSRYEDETEFIDTFTHECIHALHFTLGCQFDDTLEEILANTTGHMVAQLVAKLCSVGVMSDK